jgi:hypothetical protein
MTDNEFEKISYASIEEPLTWWEWIWGRAEPEIEADQKAKEGKYLVTEQIKKSANSHALMKMKMKMKKHQSDTSFDHTQSVIQTDQKFEDRTSELPSPYKLPLLPVEQNKPPTVPNKKLHPSIAQLRRTGIKDDLDI